MTLKCSCQNPHECKRREECFPSFRFETKTTVLNPKDAIGTDKIPLHLVPRIFIAQTALALLHGDFKYGRANYRAIGIAASIYYDALNRHMDAWFEGEDTDAESGLPHTAMASACIAIIVDAIAAGKFIDDRNYPGNYRSAFDRLTPHVARLRELHKDRPRPVRYTIQSATYKTDGV